MKVFWSWQSDHPGNISRHIVREALEEAMRELKEEPDVEEPVRHAELDHDRKGIPGSPDLANVIMEKIKGSDVFVADVTPVGATDDGKKKLINSNVAIELGYALGTVTDRALLMVMNEAFGTRDDLPFDLKHKAGPIFYQLAGSASREEIKDAKSKLVSTLKVALRPMLSARARATQRPFSEAEYSFDNRGAFFKKGEIIAQRNSTKYRCEGDALVFLRVFPTSEAPPLKLVDAEGLLRAAELGVLNDRSSGYSTATNKYGAIAYETSVKSGSILTATQLFKSRELWGFDAYMLLPGRMKKNGVPTTWYETMVAKALHRYTGFATEYLGLKPPLTVETGLTGVAGYPLLMPNTYLEDWGPVHEDVVFRATLPSTDPAALDAFLLGAFEKVFDAGGKRRPENYNGFPGDTPGKIPH